MFLLYRALHTRWHERVNLYVAQFARFPITSLPEDMETLLSRTVNHFETTCIFYREKHLITGAITS